MSDKHDRALAALELREPDRVPVLDLMLEYTTDNAILGRKAHPLHRMIALPFSTGFMDAFFPRVKSFSLLDLELERFLHLGAAAAERMDYDAAWLPYFPVLRFNDSRTMVDMYGRLNDVGIHASGNLGNPTFREGLIDSPEAWRAWDKRPLLRLPAKVNGAFSRLYKKYGEKMFILGFCSYGIFENIWQPLGFERFVVASRKDRAFLERMIAFHTDLYCELVEAMADAGLPAMVYTDDLAYKSGPMLNPRLIEELFGDSHRRIVETAHTQGMKIVIHSCGNTTALLEYFADCGFDAVHPLEPTAGMELATAKELVGGRMCLIGNLDITHILVDANRDEVFAAVRQAIADAGQGGGYILAPDHSHPDISVERLRWMVEAAREHGRYPLSP
ncbi:MAG: uroporphyrinogen decarboxylase family protein [Actinomycetota bacterium]